ncbi:MAG: histidinol-phosphate transaminase [bacterium]|nr:histidinol-phosphate transaminase [bacterium]
MPLVPKAIKELKPYSPGKPIEEVKRELGLDVVVKLASNENPWGPSPMALKAMAGAEAGLHRYPDMMAMELRGHLAERFGVERENVVVGSGSEGIMACIMRTFLCDEDEILTAANTFVGFMVLARGSGKKLTLVPRRPDYRYDLEAMAAAVNEYTKIIYLANPDNPTGTIFTRDEFDLFMTAVPDRCLVIYDEAYFEFTAGEESFPDSMSYRYDNVITLRTFSKAYGLAGIRIGYGFAHENLIVNLMKVKPPFEPSSLAQVAGLAALDDVEFLSKTVRGTAEGMAVLVDGLKKAGFNPLASYTNFIAVPTDSAEQCATLCRRLLENGAVVRPLPAFGFPDLFRVTVGTPEENTFFLQALDKALSD